MTALAFDPTLYLVTDPRLCRAHGVVRTVREGLEGGVTAVQLRDKLSDKRTVYETALALKPILQGSNVPLIINDHVDIAMAAGADGVHVGQTDLPAETVRSLVGPDMILGVSAHHEAELKRIDPAVIDYVGLGPLWATATKPDAAAALGVERARALRALTPAPVVAIGGITVEQAHEAMTAHVDGIAVVSAICGQKDPRAAAHGLRRAVDEARKRQNAWPGRRH
ncbi:MAG: thiamine phosphate synthase [Hyphomicrobiales bacterium]